MADNNYEVGQWVAVAGEAPMLVRETRDDGGMRLAYGVYEHSNEIQLDAEEALQRVRPMTARANAERLQELLDSPGPANPEEDEYDRSVAYREVARSNDLEQMLRTLMGIYCHPNPGYPEERYEIEFEHRALEELARVLGVKRPTLKRRARAGANKPVGFPDRSDEVEAAGPPPPLDRYMPLGAFAVEMSLAIGESPLGELTLPARRGVWFAYFMHLDSDFQYEGYTFEPKPGDEDQPSRLVVVHTECRSQIEDLFSSATEAGVVGIEGACLAICDSDVLDEISFRRGLFDAGSETVEGRGVRVSLGGDGRGVVHHVADDGVTVFVMVELF